MPILSSHVVDIGASPQSSQWCDALLEQVARGDQHAFEQLFDHLAPQALGLATRIIHDHAQAEEVVQEVFVEVWRKAPQFDATLGGARSWVLRLTRMRSIDRLRSFIASHDREEKPVGPCLLRRKPYPLWRMQSSAGLSMTLANLTQPPLCWLFSQV